MNLCLNVPGQRSLRENCNSPGSCGRQVNSQLRELLIFAYLALLPTFPEDLPIVFVAGVMETQKSPITEPGVRSVGVQHI